MSSTYKVCVIGAGVSGLKAAHTLLNSQNSCLSPDDIVIVEAQDRIGGRIKTDTTLSKLGVSYDLGAAWFHDTLTNSVLRDSIINGLFDPRTDGYFDDKTTAHYAQEHKGKLDSDELKLVQVLEDIETFIEIHFASLDSEDMLLKDIVALYVESQKLYVTPEQKNYCSRMIRYMELWYGIDYTRISGKYLVMSHQGRNLYNKKGYGYLIDNLCKEIHCKIHTNFPVKVIHRKIDKIDTQHRIETADGMIITADYLIVTVPHSILSLDATHEQGLKWEPPLPKPMSEAFLSIHFGSLGKVILEFNSIWWDESQERILILANSEKRDNSKSYFLPKPFEYPIYVVNYSRIVPGTSSLVVLTQSPVTEFLERNPGAAWNYMKPMLQTLLLDDKTIPDPINVIVTDWLQNPYVRGSYCALFVNDDPIDEIVQLSGEHDLCGLGSESTIRFAGEHTVSDGAGCVHGAYDSGERAAKWILSNMKTKFGKI